MMEAKLRDRQTPSAQQRAPAMATALRGTGNFIGAAGFGSYAMVGDSMSHGPTRTRDSLYLAVEVGEACQLKCRHCIYHRPQPRQAKPTDLVAEQLIGAMRRGIDPLWVSFAGKEPTLFPKRLLELAGLTKRRDRVNILMSNGLRLQGALAQELLSVIDCFDISVDGDETSHDWMRGQGTFAGTWKNIERLAAFGAPRIGIIATAVRGFLPDGTPQRNDLVALAKRLQTRFGSSGQVSLTISLYYGAPGDVMLLNADDIVALVTSLGEIDFPTRVLFTAQYSHLLGDVLRRIGRTACGLQFDDRTNLPILEFGNVRMILFNLTPTQQWGVRVSNEGKVFLGCNHLVLGSRAHDYAVADLRVTSLDQVIEEISSGRSAFLEGMWDEPAGCDVCPDEPLCRGGDRLSGKYFIGGPSDPYCERRQALANGRAAI
jgi:pyruvate-formate lyase-activating enzyme